MQTSKYEIGANLQGLEFRRQANEILAALASSNAGNLEPASAQSGTVWLDTSNDEKHLLKIRNKANNAWGILCSIDAQSGAVDAIDAYSKPEADEKFMGKEDFPAIDKAYVGLGKVDNTADSDKPISRATQEALEGITTLLNGKANAGEIPNIVRNSLNGLIFQQGTVTVTCDSSDFATVMYPIAFPATPIFLRYTYSGLGYYNILTLSYPENQTMPSTKFQVPVGKAFRNRTITVTYAALGY